MTRSDKWRSFRSAICHPADRRGIPYRTVRHGPVAALFAGFESSADLKWLNVITRCANARPVEAHENAIPVESINPPRVPHGKGDCLYFEGSIRRNPADHLLSSASERPERHASFAISIDGCRETTRITDSPHLLVQDDLLVEAARLGRADTHMHSLNHCPQPAPTKIPRSQEQARASREGSLADSPDALNKLCLQGLGTHLRTSRDSWWMLRTSPGIRAPHAPWGSPYGATTSPCPRTTGHRCPVDNYGSDTAADVTPLMESVDELEPFYDATKVVLTRLLLSASADIARRDNAGRTALHYRRQLHPRPGPRPHRRHETRLKQHRHLRAACRWHGPRMGPELRWAAGQRHYHQQQHPRPSHRPHRGQNHHRTRRQRLRATHRWDGPRVGRQLLGAVRHWHHDQ